MSAAGRLRHRTRRAAEAAQAELLRRGVQVQRLDDDERRFLTALVDDSVPLPPWTEDDLRPDHPRLADLRRLYAEADPAVRTHSRWEGDAIGSWLDLARFRGDNPYVWQYREGRRVTELKFLVFAQAVRALDGPGLLDRLTEDGAFGCWTYSFDGLPRVSRDLLDSVNELLFLDRHLGFLSGTCPRVLDIGAGYGRLAHRGVEAAKGITDWCCTDAVAESTFVCEHHLRHRGLTPPARVVPLTDVGGLEPGGFDLAVNVHSWSECTHDAVAWWVAHLERLEVPWLFVVPNEPEGFLSLEADRTRRDLLPLLAAAGYRPVVDEPAFADAAVRAALGVQDRHLLFEREP